MSIIYENENYKVIVEHVVQENGEPSHYASYMVVNKTTGVAEGQHTIQGVARDMANDFNKMLLPETETEGGPSGEQAPEATHLNS